MKKIQEDPAELADDEDIYAIDPDLQPETEYEDEEDEEEDEEQKMQKEPLLLPHKVPEIKDEEDGEEESFDVRRVASFSTQATILR